MGEMVFSSVVAPWMPDNVTIDACWRRSERPSGLRPWQRVPRPPSPWGRQIPRRARRAPPQGEDGRDCAQEHCYKHGRRHTQPTPPAPPQGFRSAAPFRTADLLSRRRVLQNQAPDGQHGLRLGFHVPGYIHAPLSRPRGLSASSHPVRRGSTPAVPVEEVRNRTSKRVCHPPRPPQPLRARAPSSYPRPRPPPDPRSRRGIGCHGGKSRPVESPALDGSRAQSQPPPDAPMAAPGPAIGPPVPPGTQTRLSTPLSTPKNA